jgi:hypothetical protein
MLRHVKAGDLDARFRSAAFAYLDLLTSRFGELVTRSLLEGFTFEGRNVPLVER